MAKRQFLLVLVLITLSACKAASTTGIGRPNSDSSPAPAAPRSSAKSNAETTFDMQAPISPDGKLTPGDALDVTKDDICVPGYSKKVRDVPREVKEQAYAEYGIKSRQPGEYEVDHLISLELGGSNSIKNLWPESYKTEPWNAHVKDKLENKLHKMICSREIDITLAQAEIARDWIAAYKKYVGPGPGGNVSSRELRTTKEVSARSKETATTDSLTQTSELIIGNYRSHIYHKPGCPDYDRVAPQNRVTFQTAAEAEAAGYRAAKNCSREQAR